MTAEVILSIVNAAADLLVVVALAAVHRQRKSAVTRYLLLAFTVWFVLNVLYLLQHMRLVELHLLLFNLSTLNSVFFLLAARHLNSKRATAEPWYNDLKAPATSGGAGVLLATVLLYTLWPDSRAFTFPEYGFAGVVAVTMGHAVWRFSMPHNRVGAVLGVIAFGALTGLMAGYILIELQLLDSNLVTPLKLISVLAHLLIIFSLAFVVARGLWQRLTAEQEDLTRILEGSPSPILLVGDDGRIERINERGRQLLGIDRRRGVGQGHSEEERAQLSHISEVLPGIDWTQDQIEVIGDGHVMQRRVQMSPQGSDEEIALRVYAARLSSVADQPGSASNRRRFVLIATDISDELERERLVREADRAKSLSVLSGGTVHHFHNKLLSVRTGLRHAETLMGLEERTRLRLPLLVRAVDQAFTLSHQLAGNLKTARESALAPIDVRSALEQALSEAEARRPDGFTVTLRDESDATAERPLRVRGVGTFLKMALENLIQNAFDAVRRGESGALEISIRRGDNNRALLLFEDDGTGVPREVRSQIFLPFFTTKEECGGTGFGLYWSRRLIEALGGSLELAHTEPGAGSCFEIDLPLCDTPKGKDQHKR